MPTVLVIADVSDVDCERESTPTTAACRVLTVQLLLLLLDQLMDDIVEPVVENRSESQREYDQVL